MSTVILFLHNVLLFYLKYYRNYETETIEKVLVLNRKE